MDLLKRATEVDEYASSTHFSVEPMLSYKLNPFTVFFFGANIGGREDPYDNHDGLSRTDQTVYTKFQYLQEVF